MSSATPAPAREKSILIQVYRSADSTEDEICQEIEARFRKSEPTSRCSRFLYPSMPDPPHINGWFIIRDTASGPKISEIFRDLPQDKPIHSRQGTSCGLVGTHLYDIGGRGSSSATENHISNQIRCLDTEKPDDGWKCEELPFYCANATTAVSGNFIYVFQTEKNGAWGCIYDTIKRRTLNLKSPHSCDPTVRPSFCFPLEGRGVFAPLTEYIEHGEENTEFYLHKADEMKWEQLEELDGVRIPFSKLYNRPYATSNGILYVYDIVMGSSVLYVCEIGSWRFHGPIPLPKFDNLDVDLDSNGLDFESNIFMVPVSDSELCFLWHGTFNVDEDEDEESPRPLCYAKILISLDPLVATLLKQAELEINALGIINCLPYDSSAEDGSHTRETKVKKGSDVSTNKQKQQQDQVDWKEHCMYLEKESQRLKQEQKDQVDWKDHCKHLEKENQRLMKDLLRLQNLVQKEDHITQTPNTAQLPHKNKLKRPHSKLLLTKDNPSWD